MITEIGNSKPDLEARFELRVFDRNAQQIATFKESTFQKVSATESTQHIPYCEVRLVTDTPNVIGLIEVGAVVEIWAARDAEPLGMLIRAVVDFVDVRIGRDADEGAAVIEFQGRSGVSSCVDSPFRGLGSGSLSDLVAAILTPHHIQLEQFVGTDADNVDYYVDVDSGYAALRLLGLTFNAVVSTSRDGRIAFTDVFEALEQLGKEPPKTITEAEILGARFRQGQRVRKRGE
jgi:hypothetical protein